MAVFKDQGFGDLNKFDGQRIEVLRDVTAEDRANGTVEPYDDLVKLIRLPDGSVVGARADEIVETLPGGLT